VARASPRPVSTTGSMAWGWRKIALAASRRLSDPSGHRSSIRCVRRRLRYAKAADQKFCT